MLKKVFKNTLFLTFPNNTISSFPNLPSPKQLLVKWWTSIKNPRSPVQFCFKQFFLSHNKLHFILNYKFNFVLDSFLWIMIVGIRFVLDDQCFRLLWLNISSVMIVFFGKYGLDGRSWEKKNLPIFLAKKLNSHWKDTSLDRGYL